MTRCSRCHRAPVAIVRGTTRNGATASELVCAVHRPTIDDIGTWRDLPSYGRRRTRTYRISSVMPIDI